MGWRTYTVRVKQSATPVSCDSEGDVSIVLAIFRTASFASCETYTTNNTTKMRLCLSRITRPLAETARPRLRRQAERGTAEADRIQAEDLHILASQSRQFAQQPSATQSRVPTRAEQQLPGKLHSSSNREASRLTLSNLTNLHSHTTRGHATQRSGDDRNTLQRRFARPKTRNTNRPQRYAAKAHPTGVKAAKKSAAMQIFECNAEACSLGHGGWKSKTPSPTSTLSVLHAYAAIKGKCWKMPED